MRPSHIQTAGQYGVALLVTVLAVGLQCAANPFLEQRLPYIALFPAIGAAVWYGGWGPALLTASLGFVSITWLIITPEVGSPLSLSRPGGVIGLLLFVISAGVIIALGQRLRSARLSADAFAAHALRPAQTLKQGIVAHQQTEDSLRVNRSQLETAQRHKDEFLAILAHELRSPLGAAMNACEVLGLANATPADVDGARTVITNQLHQAVRIVNDLLDLNRIMRGRIDFRPVHMDLVAAVAQAIQTSRPCIQSANHDLRVDLPSDPIWMNGDPVRLLQVFTNLLNNACKYTPPGGRIRLNVRKQDGQAVIRIRDNGLGIRPEMLPRLFDMFAQADDARAHSQGGMGIGLALARRLVELHLGTIEALSAGPGQGSEFIVWLPLTAPLKASVGSIDINEQWQSPVITNGVR